MGHKGVGLNFGVCISIDNRSNGVGDRDVIWVSGHSVFIECEDGTDLMMLYIFLYYPSENAVIPL